MRQSLLSLLRVIVVLPSYALVLLIRTCKWLIAPPVLLFQLLLGVPLAMRRIQQLIHPTFTPIQETDLPDDAWVRLTDATEALAADGFVPYGTFRSEELIQGSVLWLRPLVQPEHGTGGLVAHVEFKQGIRANQHFVEFSTEFEDGRVLDTNNLNLPYSLPAPSYLARVQLKDVWEPRALYKLHYDLVIALAKPIQLNRVEQANHNPAALLSDGYRREIRALAEEGWLSLDEEHGVARLQLRAAITGVWRQAWPLASLYLRAANRQGCQLMIHHHLDAEAFTGGADTIQVTHQPLPVAHINTVREGYEYIRPLVQKIDARSVLESVVVELDNDEAGTAVIREFAYAFRGYDDQPQRRIRRLWSFEILLNTITGIATTTATDREYEQADDEEEWAELTADSPLIPLQLGAWLCDLDTILPVAQTALTAHHPHRLLDSASLYIDEENAPRWQVIAWDQDNDPLHVRLDARSGKVDSD